MQTELHKSLGQTAGLKSKDCHLIAATWYYLWNTAFDLVVQPETNRVTLRNRTTGWYTGVRAHSIKTARLEQVLQIQQLKQLSEKVASLCHDHSVMNLPPRQSRRTHNQTCITRFETSCSVGTLNLSCFVLTHLQTPIYLKEWCRADKLLPLCLNTKTETILSTFLK